MNYKPFGLGLGLFSLSLGSAELFAARRIARALDAEGHEALVRAFGAREVLAGTSLVMAPAVATGVWNRVAGDALDLIATGAAVRNSPSNRLAWGALGFVVGATLIDLWVAQGLDRQTGRTWPRRVAGDPG